MTAFADTQPEYVHPGQLAAGNAARAFATVLGSCIAVCLHDPVVRLGGLNHFVLPAGPDARDTSTRYAPGAITELVQRLVALGARERRLVAQVIGGANVLGAFKSHEDHLGLRNASTARVLLAERRIPIVFADVGGTRGRRLLFHPGDGTHVIHLLGR